MFLLLIETRYIPPGRGSSVASIPGHFTILSASVKNEKTTLGGAAIRTSRTTASVLGTVATTWPPHYLGVFGAGFRLGGFFEEPEPSFPEARQKFLEPVEPLGA